jgi:hypothetical protein
VRLPPALFVEMLVIVAALIVLVETAACRTAE